jgi:hypothetical protein
MDDEDGNVARIRAIQGKLLGFQTGVDLKKTVCAPTSRAEP